MASSKPTAVHVDWVQSWPLIGLLGLLSSACGSFDVSLGHRFLADGGGRDRQADGADRRAEAGTCDRQECGLCVPNPSFEGEADYSRAPEPYVECDSRPDTLDGDDEDPDPTDGETYLRLEAGSDPENASAELCERLTLDGRYEFAIDLALGDRERAGDAVRFQIWGGDAECDRSELLWSVELSDSDERWDTYHADFSPSQAHSHVTLEARSEGASHVLVDNLVACDCARDETDRSSD